MPLSWASPVALSRPRVCERSLRVRVKESLIIVAEWQWEVPDLRISSSVSGYSLSVFRAFWRSF